MTTITICNFSLPFYFFLKNEVVVFIAVQIRQVLAGMVIHIHNPRTQKSEMGELQIQGQPWLHNPGLKTMTKQVLENKAAVILETIARRECEKVWGSVVCLCINIGMK